VTDVAQGGAVGGQVDNWPKNPWTNEYMAQSTAKGDYTYALGTDAASFTLAGHLSDGTDFTVGTTAAP